MFLGIAPFMDNDGTTSQVVVQRRTGISIEQRYAETGIRKTFRAGTFIVTLHSGTDCTDLSDRSMQSVSFNRSQLCRWLLLSLDWLLNNELTMTQESIANMLGIRREGVTEAVGKLRKLGLIHYKLDHIEHIDRTGIEAMSCGCFVVVKKEHDRFLAKKIKFILTEITIEMA